MKKQWIIAAIAAVFAGIMFSACGNSADSNTNLKEPTTTQQEPPAANAEQTAATTAIPAGENEQEEEGEEAHEKEGKKTPGAPAGATANSTEANLVTAFTGETTASAKYAAYAKKAQEEGYPQIALLFKAASEAEHIHANNHKAVLEDMGKTVPAVQPRFTVKSTRENLQDAVSGESYEISTMYPAFLSQAQSAGSQLALISLNYAFKTEQKHKTMYEKALTALQNQQVNTLPSLYYVCSTCGNTYEAKAPKRCGISMTKSDRFLKIDLA